MAVKDILSPLHTRYLVSTLKIAGAGKELITLRAATPVSTLLIMVSLVLVISR